MIKRNLPEWVLGDGFPCWAISLLASSTPVICFKSDLQYRTITFLG